MIRTLPFRVAPSPGEALDSWIETIASRHGVTLAEILAGVGIRYDPRPLWMVFLGSEQSNALSVMTEIDPAAIAAMTMQGLDGRALAIHHDGDEVRLAIEFPFGTRWRSRYCPQCLDESDGRWQVIWRSGWSFACTKHRRLLADVCPRCSRVQRYTAHPVGLVPRPGFCALPARETRRERCGGYLRQSQDAIAGCSNGMIEAQAIILRVIADGYANFGIYRQDPQPAATALADIKTLCVRILSHAKRQGLNKHQRVIEAPEQLRELLRWRHFRNTEQCKAPEAAFDAGIGLWAAVKILSSDSITDAAEILRSLIVQPVRGTPRGLSMQPSDSQLGAAITISAFRPFIGARMQLRYRTALPVPVAPRAWDNATSPPKVASRIPSLLWPAWSLRLISGDGLYDHRRMALSCAVLLVGSHCSLSEAVRWLGDTTRTDSAAQLLAPRQWEPHWRATSLALIHLSDYLHSTPPPIDYAGRRQLDFTHLLPSQTWLQICRETGTPQGFGQKEFAARCFLFEMLSGYPARKAPYRNPYQDIGNVLWSRVRNFPFMLTPSLAVALHEEAARFLAEHHIKEPLTWHPPLCLLDDLDLPNGSVDEMDTELLQRLANSPSANTHTLARDLGVDINSVRYQLEQRPIRLSPQSTTDNRRRSLVSSKFREVLDPGRLNELYVVQGTSLRAIARYSGFSDTTVRRMCLEYGIPLRKRTRPERGWLYEQLIVRRSSLSEIARQVGLTADTVGHWIRRYGLDASVAQASQTTEKPKGPDDAMKLLEPALQGGNSWARLHEFVDCLAYQSMSEAAIAMGKGASSLRSHVRELEGKFGFRLMERARLPLLRMVPTEMGVRVTEAVRVCDLAGYPLPNGTGPAGVD